MAANDTRRLRVVIEGESSKAEQAFERTGKAAEKSDGAFSKVAKTVGGFAIRGGAALAAVATAAGTMGITTATSLEQATVGFTTMLGSAEKAKKFLGQLQSFAAATPFEFDELTGAAQKFLAMGFSAEKIVPMLTAVGDAVAAMGGSAENIDSVTTALSQMQAKGKVSGEELMQLTEQGIPALQILADKYGVSTSAMSKMIEKGQVQSSKAIPAIIDALENGTKHVQGFGGMMAKQSETMAGKWSTFMDTLKTGLANVVSGALPTLKKALDIVSTALGNFFAGLQGKGKAAGFSGTINEIALGLRALVGAFKEGDVTSDGLVGKFEMVGAAAHGMIDAFKTGKVESGGWRGELELIAVVIRKIVDIQIAWYKILIQVIGWLKQHETTAKTLFVAIGLLVAVTKAHAIALAISNGAMKQAITSTAIYSAGAKVAAALQWAWNGAVAAAKWLQMAVLLDGYLVKQKLVAVWSKVVAAAQWVWNAALAANPIGLVVIAIAAFIAAIVLLWKNSDSFRNWVMNKLWPSIKQAWEQMKAIGEAVASAFVAAWNWIKNTAIAVWNAIINFLRPIGQGIMTVLSPVISVIQTIGNVMMIFYVNFWKAIWILVQIAVKLAVIYFQNVILPLWKIAFTVLQVALKGVANFFSAIWGGIQKLLQGVSNWYSNTIVPLWNRGMAQLQTALAVLRIFFNIAWTAIQTAVSKAVNAIVGPIIGQWRRGMDVVKAYIAIFQAAWDARWDAMKTKINSFKDGVVKAFNLLKDGIKTAWDKLVAIAKTPVNFLIGNIYSDRIVPMWNKVASAFGIKTRLDTIPRLKEGGMVPGVGFTDKVPALLTPGEGVLTLDEMSKLGGPAGFAALRQQIAEGAAAYKNGGVVQHFADGGVVGWFKSLASKGKSIIQGLAGNAIQPLADLVKRVINNGLGDDGIQGLMKGGSNKLIDGFMSWVKGKDKEAPAIGTGGGNIGWKGMWNLIKAAFPGASLLSGFRPGAHTLSGNLSYHALGRAVDVSPMQAIAQWIRSNFGSRTLELITPWRNLDLWHGAPHTYSNALHAQHSGSNAHVHWAMDGATTLEPGMNIGWNRTGRRETVINKDLIPSGITINGGLHLHGVQDVKSLRDELQRLSKRNGGRAGLPAS